MCILINCFNAKLSLFRETLPVAMTVRFTASAVMMWPICYGDPFFQFPPVTRDTADCVSSDRLREVKNNWRF